MSEEKRKNSSSDRNTAYVLIGIGIIFLLVNVLNISFARLWPLLLVALGVYLLMARSNSIGSSAKTGTFSAPLEGASAADVELRLSLGQSQVDSQVQPGNLIDAELTYVGEIDFEVSGAEHKTLRLGQHADAALHWINPANWFGAEHGYHWQISLNPDVPTNLDLRGGAGEMQLDLAQLKLTGLRVQGGAGEMHISLPESESGYPVRINGGLGEMRIKAPAHSSATMEIQGGVGEVIIDTGSETALRVNGHGGIGDVKVPAHLTRVSGGSSEFELGKTGVWESPGFEQAAHKLVINYQGGVGTLRVR